MCVFGFVYSIAHSILLGRLSYRERLIAQIIINVELGVSNYTHTHYHHHHQPTTHTCSAVFQEQELKLVELNHNVNSAKSKVCIHILEADNNTV